MWILALAAVATFVGLALWFWSLQHTRASRSAMRQLDQRTAMAVVGDSDSHGYQDSLTFPPSSKARGGLYRGGTFQWTEVLALLRGHRIDLGEWAEHGVSPGRLADALTGLGLTLRVPQKKDHRYNFAVSGAGCQDLWKGGSGQMPQLLRAMEEDPAHWSDGVVVIRIGVNTFGTAADLDLLARDSRAESVVRKIDFCLTEIERSVRAIHRQNSTARVVLVGIFDNANWPKYMDRWQSNETLARIAKGLDLYDHGLSALAKCDRRIAFFDDRAWFAGLWGARGRNGRPAYRAMNWKESIRVTNSMGDAPNHAILADGHGGAVWNAKWAQALVELLNYSFATRIEPITDDEILRLLKLDV